ncbi:tRNA (N6-threonylcarbamoyladenosine(37)-N6)-methyltransferase TrmO [Halovulum dunhuangense]|uniref:tRNA (N6-threonylcarbamoyladenosine(37)-N6)-methyltransferase TrmO n=1 Tax=Halovulum dunhuangense TaxID=1505036 RepID=A0A849L257_9RHOB|nr:tRNA (N6-threonylcarbamoyladenosine(37)-N6)-methyltransferase TrmO [Halovulum dunhuangense]
MSDRQAIRPHEIATDAPLPRDASIAFIGVIRTPWTRREDCPHQGKPDGPECVIELTPPWDRALDGIEGFDTIEVFYWLHLSRRDLLVQNPRHANAPRGTFSLRSPIRPNPIGASTVRLVRRDGPRLVVRGLECVDGTPLIDLKPDHCHYTPPKAGD